VFVLSGQTFEAVEELGEVALGFLEGSVVFLKGWMKFKSIV
jgi:hypothetical protein